MDKKIQHYANDIKSNSLLMSIGKLISNAATCDAIMFSVFVVISKCDIKIAQAIYYSNTSHNQKSKLIMRVLPFSGDYKKQHKIIERIIMATEKANNQRNQLSHCLLRIIDDEVVYQNPRNTHQSISKITEKGLNKIIELSINAFIDCYQASQELSEKWGVELPIDQ